MFDQAKADPVHFTEPHVLCTLPAGAQIISMGLQIIVVAPGAAACYLTPTGLKPIAVAPSVRQDGGA